MIVQSRATQDQVIDLEVPVLAADNAITPLISITNPSEPCIQESERNPPEHGVRDFQSQIAGPITTEVHTVQIANEDAPMANIEAHVAEDSIGLQNETQGLVARGTSRDAGPFTKLALREPTLIADLLKAGFSEPFPETAPSEAELVHMMNGWMAQHPDRNPPWSSTLNRRVLGRDFSYSVAISLTSTSEEIFTSVRQLGSSRMTYTLMDNDGACMIGRPVAGNGTYKRAYYGWLGGDLGFTSKPFVSSDWLRSQDLASETVSSRNEQSIVMANQDTQRDPSNDIELKKEPNLTEVRQATLRRNQAERQIQGPRWRSQTPPLSSMGIVKRNYGPRQYVSPRPTPKAKERKAGDAKTYPNRDRSRTSSPEFVSESPISPPQGLRRSARANHFGSYRLPSLPRTPKRTRTTAKKSANVVEPAVTNLQPPIQDTQDVKIHFFLSNDSLGAVPVAMDECNTASNFFNQALSAWNLLGGGDHAGTMAAVSVTIDGFHWPIVLPWGNATAFERMKETMAIVKTGKVGNLEVKVKCIKTRSANVIA